MKKENVQKIIDNCLCAACGACSGICPKKAINMQENIGGYLVAHIIMKLCIDCGKCLSICPSNPDNTPNVPYDLFHGVCLDGYIGHATDGNIRLLGQSGGVITALLEFLLDQNIIDGAVVNSFNEIEKRPQVIVADNVKAIRNSTGSIYSQSAVVETVLKNTEKRLASVTLGCQSESLRLIGQKYKSIQLPYINIGLICDSQYSGKFIDDLINQTKCKKKDVKYFRFRDKTAGGWPGNVKVYGSNGTYELDKKQRHLLKQVYEVPRCLVCYDKMNIFSDISVGDPWGIEGASKEGSSIIIARTDRGKRVLEEARKTGRIKLKELNIDDIFRGQKIDKMRKEQVFSALINFNQNNYKLPYMEEILINSLPLRGNNKVKNMSYRVKYAFSLFSAVSNYKAVKLIWLKKKRIHLLKIRNSIKKAIFK